ncbi:MAG TPA: hypothetical protein PKE55_14835 [Kiritimatiellia bacterium]|nr:hypothetical protein [Kiritimatiellia bacterium]
MTIALLLILRCVRLIHPQLMQQHIHSPHPLHILHLHHRIRHIRQRIVNSDPHRSPRMLLRPKP